MVIKFKNRISLISLILALMLFAFSCGDSNNKTVSSPATPTQITQQLPTLNQLDQLPPRSSSAETTVNGSDAIKSSSNTKIEGSGLIFTGDKSLSWAIYRLGKFENDKFPVSGKLEYTINEGTIDDTFGRDLEIWIGYSNYKIKSWSWIKYDRASQSGLDFSSIIENIINPSSGFCFLTVAVKGADLTLSSIKTTPKDVVKEVWQDTLAVEHAYFFDVSYYTRSNISIGKINDKPMLCYKQENDLSGDDLYFALAKTSTPTGPNDWNIMLLQNNIVWSPVYSMVENDGKPVICYIDSKDDGSSISKEVINYVYARNSQPKSVDDWIFTKVNSYTEDWGSLLPVIHLNNKPFMVSTIKLSSENKLCFNQCKTPTPTGPSDWDYYSLPIKNYNTAYDICLVNNKPVISYKVHGEALTYMAAKTSNPTVNDWETHIIDKTVDKSYYDFISMYAINDKPVVVYVMFNHEVMGYLKIALATTATPSSEADWKTYDIDKDTKLGANPKLLAIGDVPIITYNKTNTNKELFVYYAQATSANPSSSADWTISKTFQIIEDITKPNLEIINSKPTFVFNNNQAIYLAHRWLP